MAAGKQEYIATFSIGARLLGSFRGAMAAAQARMARLQAGAMRVGAAMKKMAMGLSVLGGLFAGIAAFGIGKIFERVFSDANKEITEANDRTRKLTAALLKNQHIAKKGPAYVKQQADEMAAMNTEAAKTGLIAADTLDTMGAQVALSGLAPSKIQASMGPMSDVLVAMKGVHATEEDGRALATAWGKALRGGPVKGLQQFGITVGPKMAKAFKSMGIDEINAELLKLAKFAKGKNIEALADPEGKVVKLNEEIGEMAERIGKQVLPARGAMADAWRTLIPEIEPYLAKLQSLAVGAQMGIANFVKNTLLPALKDFSKWISGPFSKVWGNVAASWNYMISMVGPAFMKMFGQVGGEGKDFATILGETVVKALQTLADVLKWVGDNAEWLVPTVTALAVAFTAASVAIGILNAVLAVTPIGWIIIGIAALIAGLVLLIKYPKQISAWVDKMWQRWSRMGLIGAILKLAFLPLYQAIKVITWLAQVDWGAVWEGLKTAATAVWDFLVAGWNRWIGNWSKAIGIVKTIWTTAKDWLVWVWGEFTGFLVSSWSEKWDWLKGMIDIFKNVFKTAIDFIWDSWKSFTQSILDFKLPNWLRKILGLKEGAEGSAFQGGGGGFGGTGSGSSWGGAGGGAAAGVAGGQTALAQVPLSAEGRAAIQAERADIIKDLQRPEIRNLVSATLAREMGGAEAQKDVLENLVNRSVAYKAAGKYGGVEQMIKGGFYGPYNRGETQATMAKGLTDARSEQVMAMINEVGAGRNVMRGMTDQGVNVGQREYIRGEGYSYAHGFGQQYKTAAYLESKKAAEGAVAGATAGAAAAAPEVPPYLAKLAGGGVVDKPTLAMVGESGPEAITPLGKGGAGGTNVHFAPNITINGNATETEQRALDNRLRDLARDFIAQFKAAQTHERRLSYEGGYG